MRRRTRQLRVCTLIVWVATLLAWDPTRAQREAVPAEAMRRNNLGVALMDAGTRDPKYMAEAVREFEAALGVAPAYELARRNLGVALYYAGETQRSTSVLEQWIVGRPDSAHAHYVLGLLREYGAQFETAAHHFRRVTDRDASDPDAWYHLGFCLTRLGRHEEAVTAYRRAAAITPYQKRLRYGLFMALTRAGRTTDAQTELEAFRALGDSQVRVVDGPKNALEYLKQGRYAEAVADSQLRPASPRSPAYVDIAARLGIRLPAAPAGTVAARSAADGTSLGAAFVDVDGDSRLDVYTLAGGSHALFVQQADGRFVRSAAVPAATGVLAAVWGDLDNDGAPDLVAARVGRLTIFSNRRGRLVAGKAAIALPTGYVAAGLALADVDHDGDLDIAVVGGVGPPARRPNLLLRNNNDGTFTETGRASGIADAGTPALRVWFSDVDEDRAVDAVIVGPGGTRRVLLNRKDGTFAASPSTAAPALISTRLDEARAYGDVDRNGSVDELVVEAGRVRLHRNDTRPAHWLTVRPRGYAVPGKLKSNRLGIGTTVEVRSPGLWQRREVRAGNGLGGTDAAEITFDLGREARLDFVRAVFPSGVRRTETRVQVGAAMTLEEPLLDVNSCPTLFTWNGDRFEFVTDTLSAGILGELVAPGQYWHPDPDEWVRIEGRQLRPDAQGHLAIRFTNPLEEVTYLDAVRLVAVDHRADEEVHSDERMRGRPSTEPVRLFTVARTRPAARATDHHGHDVSDAVRTVDRRYFDHFTPRPFKGFGGDWALTIDLGALTGNAWPVLGLDGWSYWNSSAAVVAASQAGERLWGPVLDVQGSDGRWRLATDDLGLHAGLPRPMLIDLRPYLRAGERVVRIRGNRTVYYDRVRVGEATGAQSIEERHSGPLQPVAVPVIDAQLRWLGYPRRSLPGGTLPDEFDYHDVQQEADWGTHAGLLTRYGDVRALLAAPDDHMAIMGHGDEVALVFDATPLTPPRPGWQRTWFFYADGFEKGYEISSAHADTVEPLPFQGMPAFPYAPSSAPADPAYVDYQLLWNTRPPFLRAPR